MTPAAGGSENVDRVTLTAAAQRLLELADSAPAGTAPVDQARINAIRQSIDDGTYEINHAQVVDRLLSFDND